VRIRLLISAAAVAATVLAGNTSAAGAASAAATSAAEPAITHVPHGLRPSVNGTQESTNWAGYVAAGGGYTSVYATWNVPTVTITSDNRYSATWIGVGGDPTTDLVQAGSAAESVNGQARYYVWTEILPEPETQAFAVNPGDLIQVSVVKKALPPTRWVMTVTDVTSGRSVQRSTAYASLKLTAEWIHAAPTVGGLQSKLAVTPNVVFDNGWANGKRISQEKRLNIIYMNDSSNHHIGTPGPLASDGDGFAVAYGPNPPPAPN
jgi:hypothetical protein